MESFALGIEVIVGALPIEEREATSESPVAYGEAPKQKKPLTKVKGFFILKMNLFLSVHFIFKLLKLLIGIT